MKKLILAAIVAAFAVAGPAQADKSGDDRGGDRAAIGAPDDRGSKPDDRGSKPADPGSRGRDKAKDDNRGRGDERRARKCGPRGVGYLAFGTFVASTLTQTKGADTADNPRDDRFSGMLTVKVTKGNRAARADVGTEKVYTLTDAKIRLADRDDNGTLDQPVAGDRTKVQGKTTRLRRGCDITGFTPELKIKKVMFFDPPEVPAPAPAPTP